MTIKDTLADLGIDACVEFCEVNNIPQPKLNIYRNADDPKVRMIKGFATCGYYRNNEIFVAVPLCSQMNPMYSWAGFIADRTPYGVIQHELGHHVDQVKSGYDLYRNRKVSLSTSAMGAFSTRIRELSGEPPITSYSPDTMEWFAEIFRLFVTNPMLLAKIRPRAYDAICSQGLIPVGDLDEKEVLEQFQAPPRVYERMNNWITKGK